MKFIVKVRLVEKSVNKTVGMVIDVKVTTQYRIFGINFAISSSVLAKNPNHEPGGLPSEAPAMSDAFARDLLAMVLIADLKLVDGVVDSHVAIGSALECILHPDYPYYPYFNGANM